MGSIFFVRAGMTGSNGVGSLACSCIFRGTLLTFFRV